MSCCYLSLKYNIFCLFLLFIAVAFITNNGFLTTSLQQIKKPVLRHKSKPHQTKPSSLHKVENISGKRSERDVSIDSQTRHFHWLNPPFWHFCFSTWSSWKVSCQMFQLCTCLIMVPPITGIKVVPKCLQFMTSSSAIYTGKSCRRLWKHFTFSVLT